MNTRVYKPPRRRAVAALAALALTATAATAWFASSEASADADEPKTNEDTWSDEFDGAAGSPPDSSKWTHEVNGDGGGNGELQYYTDSTDNASLDGNGNLNITARNENPDNLQCWYGTCEYTSARLNTATTFTQGYGHFEARVQVTRGQGMWPAFWMLGESFFDGVSWPDCGEIDILENVGHEPSTVHGSLHGPGYSGGNPLTDSYTLPDGGVFADDFHVFAVDWSPGAVSWSVDGQQYHTKTVDDAGGNPWPFDDQAFFMIMNVAVGGEWPGPPDDTTEFPQTMTVDYVRVEAWDG
ncbi:MAG: glycoside hydrolase family 16 protein [Stackebrandtia sp.]